HDGSIKELICTYDPESRGGKTADGRKIKGTIHWVSAAHAVNATVNQYDRLFNSVNPGSEEDIVPVINPDSNIVAHNSKFEPAIEVTGNKLAFQFERLGYFISDIESSSEQPVFNRTMTLRDSWAKIGKS
ncbi:MAG: glutamine--tRNA ligase, partial [Gallionellaceae bacterium]